MRYVVQIATENEANRFEAHLQRCDECLDDVIALWRVSSFVERWGRNGELGADDLAIVLRAGARRRRAQTFFLSFLVAAAAFLIGSVA